MPQLNVAPSPSPVVAPPASADAASTGTTAGATAAADGPPAQPFAAVLQRQVAQQTSAPTGKAAAALAALAAGGTDPAAAVKTGKFGETDDQPSTDVIAAIAQMLAGITPAAPQQASQEALAPMDAKGRKPATEDDTEDAIMLATSGPAALPVAVAAPEVPEAGAPKPSSGLGSIAMNQAENLAADSALGSTSHAGSGKTEGAENFESLLAMSKEPPPIAMTGQTGVHATREAGSSATTVSSPVGAHGWDAEVGEKLTWMVNRQESRAELVLNPPQLGRIEVSLSLNGDQANAVFVSPHPAVREALENAVPRLREILQDAGIALGQAQVGAESFQQQAGSRENGDNSTQGNGTGRAVGSLQDTVVGTSHSPAQLLRRGNGLVDVFA